VRMVSIVLVVFSIVAIFGYLAVRNKS
jgi:hypothetical protein